jgi:hypothetical protein
MWIAGNKLSSGCGGCCRRGDGVLTQLGDQEARRGGVECVFLVGTRVRCDQFSAVALKSRCDPVVRKRTKWRVNACPQDKKPEIYVVQQRKG